VKPSHRAWAQYGAHQAHVGREDCTSATSHFKAASSGSSSRCIDTEAQEFWELGPNIGARQVQSWVTKAHHTAKVKCRGPKTNRKEQSDALEALWWWLTEGATHYFQIFWVVVMCTVRIWFWERTLKCMYTSCQNITQIKENINKDTSLLALVFSSRKIHTLILRGRL